MPKRGIKPPEPRPPERPDLDAGHAFPDAAFSDDALYENLALDGQERASQRASGVTFERVACTRTSLRGSTLLRPRLYDTSFEACDLSGCVFEDLVGERIECREVRALGLGLSGAVLDDLSVTGGDWPYALFLEARLTGAVFGGVNLREASFQGADLSGVRFLGCDLSRADFRDARLTGTDFRGSQIGGVSVHAKDLKGAVIGPEQAVDLIHLLGVALA